MSKMYTLLLFCGFVNRLVSSQTSTCLPNDWKLSRSGQASVAVSFGGGATAAGITAAAEFKFPLCAVANDFKFSLHEAQKQSHNGNTIYVCVKNEIAGDIYSITKSEFTSDSDETTAKIAVAFEEGKLTQTMYSSGTAATEKVLKFCMRARFQVDGVNTIMDNTAVIATIDTSVSFDSPTVKVQTVIPDENLLDIDIDASVNAYACKRDGAAYLGLTAEQQSGLAESAPVFNLCITGYDAIAACTGFHSLMVQQAGKQTDIRVNAGANTKPLLTVVLFGKTITDLNSVTHTSRGCVAEILLPTEYFDHGAPTVPAVTISGVVKLDIAALVRRRQLRRQLQDVEATEESGDEESEFSYEIQLDADAAMVPATALISVLVMALFATA